MATKSILKNIEISDPAEAEKLVKALEEAKKICDGAHFCVEGCETCNDNEDCDFSRAESEEGMERLTEKQYRALWIDLVEESNAQQQEIDKLKDTIKGNYAIVKALTADKDEQAGRLMKMDYLLRRTLPILEVANDQQGLIDAINALLGGKEE